MTAPRTGGAKDTGVEGASGAGGRPTGGSLVTGHHSQAPEAPPVPADRSANPQVIGKISAEEAEAWCSDTERAQRFLDAYDPPYKHEAADHWVQILAEEFHEMRRTEVKQMADAKDGRCAYRGQFSDGQGRCGLRADHGGPHYSTPEYRNDGRIDLRVFDEGRRRMLKDVLDQLTEMAPSMSARDAAVDLAQTWESLSESEEQKK